MKRFVIYIATLGIITVAMMYLLDALYTYVYNHGGYRNKVMWVRDFPSGIELDYIIIGSSRANYHVNPKQVEQRIGKVGYNLGYNGSNPFETKLMFKEFLKIGKVKRLFVQVDYTFIYEQPDLIGQLNFIPYLNEDEIYKEFMKVDSSYVYTKHVPFYRYQKFESRLGYRNVIMSALSDKTPKFTDSLGFTFVSKVLKNDKGHSKKLINVKNRHLKEINLIAKQEGIEVTFFTAPVFKPNYDLNKLEDQLTNYSNFIDAIEDRNYFNDPTHLNAEGAKIFTDIFIDQFYKTKEDSVMESIK